MITALSGIKYSIIFRYAQVILASIGLMTEQIAGCGIGELVKMSAAQITNVVPAVTAKK